ncbi:hypothetical protein DB88DRAFT_501735 [Papiliotrema laurentii]|uniref:Uncharacterized protein n=1 Tax=Papiliotrema laurentii TaxID=5418 RepID=A0AAD9CT17_PAPLA|nr:hypothetical protein DB88DRAFT_501735 [Papiliotrema laurentii]
MSYPSIISQPGSAKRNLEPIIQQLAPLVNGPPGSSRILELASYPYEHIAAFAQQWPEVEWWGSCRDEGEAEVVRERYTTDLPVNLNLPEVLDVSNDSHWASLDAKRLGGATAAFDGVIMLNLVHCCPEDVPENIFKHLSPLSPAGPRLLDPNHGWIAAYGAYKNDDGTYKSPGDEEFDQTYIRAKDPSLGLRTIASVSAFAGKWGFVEESRTEMPKGNMFVVWRVGRG